MIAAVTQCCNESSYLLEWLTHHYLLGFNKFFVYIHNHQKSEEWELLQKKLLDSFDLTILEARKTGKTPNIQMDNYTDALERCRGLGVDWLMAMDLDEYLVIKKASIQEVIDTFPTAVQICFPWKVFGSNYHLSRTPQLHFERFTRASRDTFRKNSLVKSITKCKSTSLMGLHIHHTDQRFTLDSSGEPIKRTGRDTIKRPLSGIGYVSHFAVRSREEFLEKADRGYPDHRWHSATPIGQRYWDVFDRNEVECLDGFEYVPSITHFIHNFETTTG